MPCTIAHVLVALDGSARDREVADVAGRLATTTGVSLAVVLPRTAQVTARLSPFAASEDLVPADAAEAYADHIAEPLRRRGIPTSAAAVLADDAAAAITAYADRHHSAMILTAGGDQEAAAHRRRTARADLADAAGRRPDPVRPLGCRGRLTRPPAWAAFMRARP